MKPENPEFEPEIFIASLLLELEKSSSPSMNGCANDCSEPETDTVPVETMVNVPTSDDAESETSHGA